MQRMRFKLQEVTAAHIDASKIALIRGRFFVVLRVRPYLRHSSLPTNGSSIYNKTLPPSGISLSQKFLFFFKIYT